MHEDYESFTVLKLKGLCKERNLPVSGTKKVLINRLKEADGLFIPTPQIISDAVPKKKTIEIQCIKCPTILRVPAEYEGMISCPSCSTKQSVLRSGTGKATVQTDSNTNQPTEDLTFGLTKQQLSIGIMILGVGVMLLGIWLALMEWKLWFNCEMVLMSGDDYVSRGCGQGTFLPTMFSACCLLLPFGFFLTTFGYNLIQSPAVTPQVHSGAVSYNIPTTFVPQSTVVAQHQQLNPRSKGNPLGEAIQATAVGLSVGVVSLVTIIGGIIALLLLIIIIASGLS